MAEKEINADVMRALSHKKYYVTNVVGGVTDQDFRFELLNEKISTHKTNWRYISDAMIILTPIGAKNLLELLQKNIDIWENEKGKIQTTARDKHIIEINK